MAIDPVSLIFYILFAVLGLTIVVLVWRLFRRRKMKALDYKVLLIKINKPDANEKSDLLKEINLSEQLINSLASLGKPFVFEVAVPSTGQSIQFYLAVPREALDFATRQIQGLFLDAQVSEAPDYTVFYSKGHQAIGSLRLDNHFLLPLRSYRESETDTFAPVVSTLSKLSEESEGGALQFVIQPAGSFVQKEAAKVLEELKRGKKFKDITNQSLVKTKDIEKIIFNDQKKEEDKKEIVVDEETVKAIQQKISKPLYYTNVRVVAASKEPYRADDLFLAMAGAFNQFAAPNRNSFKIVRPKKNRQLVFDFVFREFDPDSVVTLNSEELASIFHLPTLSSDVPHVVWAQAKEMPPPENLPTEGLILGESVFRGEVKPVRLTDDDRRRHLYMIGQTGTGKSKFMLSLVKQDMENGQGLCVVDPHGELIDDILAVVPSSRIDDVIVFNPGDLSRPLGLNMLEFNPERPEEKTFIVNEMQSIFNQLFTKETMGPMFEKYMRNALLLLMEDSKNEPATLMEVPRVFTDVEFRERKLARSINPTVVDFWTKEAPKTSGEQGLANMAPYITSKFDNFISNDYIRPIIGQTKSAFNFRQVMDEGKILLVNLSKGRIGDINSGLIGMVVVGRLLLAALSRENLSDKDRRDFYLYIDEFQNYTTDSIATILSEARKYRLNLVIAHQFIAQLKENIREAVFGNAGNLVSFRVGPQDAEFLIKHFGPQFTEKDLISLENQRVISRLLVSGQPSKPFDFKMRWVERGSDEVREKLKELSRLTYGRELGQIENEIVGRLRG